MKILCKVEGCSNEANTAKMCNAHYLRWTRYGRLHSVRRANGTHTITSHGYRLITVDGEQKYEHIVNAEKSLRKPLPKGAEVHFVNGDRANPTNSNLVICPDRSYGVFLKMRRDALAGTGDPRKRKCNQCKEWDLPKNMYCYANASKDGYRFRHQQSNNWCVSFPIPKEKIPVLRDDRDRHYHWLDYLE